MTSKLSMDTQRYFVGLLTKDPTTKGIQSLGLGLIAQVGFRRRVGGSFPNAGRSIPRKCRILHRKAACLGFPSGSSRLPGRILALWQSSAQHGQSRAVPWSSATMFHKAGRRVFGFYPDFLLTPFPVFRDRNYCFKGDLP